MKDEIKEILDSLKSKVQINGYLMIGVNDCKLLLDYITNLRTIEQQYSAILSENAELENKITNLQEELKGYKSRCEKLREYINTHQLFKYIYDDEELFEIITDKEAKKDLENILN